MNSLLFATSCVILVLLKTCGGNAAKKEESFIDSLQQVDPKKEMINRVDTPQSIHSEIQSGNSKQPNQENGVIGDTTKRIYYHKVPNQQQLDSIKKLKTKNK